MPTSLMCTFLLRRKRKKNVEVKIFFLFNTHARTSNTKTVSICTQTCSNVVIRYAEIRQNVKTPDCQCVYENK